MKKSVTALVVGLKGGLGVAAIPTTGEAATSWKVIKTKDYSDVPYYIKTTSNKYMWI